VNGRRGKGHAADLVSHEHCTTDNFEQQAKLLCTHEVIPLLEALLSDWLVKSFSLLGGYFKQVGAQVCNI